jgi:hypothetical protein
MRNTTPSKDVNHVEDITSSMPIKRRRVMNEIHSMAVPTPQNLLNTNHTNKTVVSKRRKKRTRESIAREYEMEKKKLVSMLTEATNETDKLKRRVEKLKRRWKRCRF